MQFANFAIKIGREKKSENCYYMTALREGRKYPCDQCTYMATAPNALKRHIQSIHELVKHPCDSCSYRQLCGSVLLRLRLKPRLRINFLRYLDN